MKDPFLNTHQGSVSVIHLVSKASKGEVPVSRESALRLGIRRAFKFSPKVKLPSLIVFSAEPNLLVFSKMNSDGVGRSESQDLLQ